MRYHRPDHDAVPEAHRDDGLLLLTSSQRLPRPNQRQKNNTPDQLESAVWGGCETSSCFKSSVAAGALLIGWCSIVVA